MWKPVHSNRRGVFVFILPRSGFVQQRAQAVLLIDHAHLIRGDIHDFNMFRQNARFICTARGTQMTFHIRKFHLRLGHIDQLKFGAAGCKKARDNARAGDANNAAIAPL